MNRLREGDLLARRYQLVEQIGAGGMSVIWRGIDQSLQRVVAIKVRDAPLSAGRTERDLIRQEARAAARIEHPDAIEVYDYGEAVTTRGRLAAYVVMQLVDGSPLAARIAEGPMPWTEAVEIAGRVASVVATAHERGIVHRDVTPDNVLLTTGGVKLLDFGIAARVGEPDTAGGASFGTPPYVAPERLTDAPVMPATDVYSLGVLLYEMVTGVTPYPETTWEEIAAARRSGPAPTPDGVPERVARLCQQCLATNPAERPSAEFVSDDLHAVLADHRRRGRRHRRLALVTAVVAIAGVTGYVGLGAGFWAGTNRGAGIVATSSGVGPSSPSSPGSGPSSPPGSSPAVRSPGVATSPPVSKTRVPNTPTLRPAEPDVAEVRATIDDVINRGEADGSIRSDVAVDLRQQVNNLVTSDDDHWELVAGLRRKVQDRLRERSITPAVASELDAAAVALGGAIDRAR
jgi:serine/threonine protein kinase